MKEEYGRFLKKLSDYKEISESMDQGEVTMMDYRSVSCGVGTYPQREERHMLRLRVPGGRLLKEQLGEILELCEEHAVRMMKCSTGQSLQFHDLAAETVRRMIPALWEKDLMTIGAGGNYPANVMASPLAGVDPEEFFDVMPYAEAASKFLVESMDVIRLPRKFKVSFSGSTVNETHATFKDLGYIACPDGTFEVYAAGGLGIQPRLGVKVAEHVDPRETLYYLKAMLLTFSEKGNYLNWKKARSRYLQDTLGVEELKAEILRHVEELRKTEDLLLPEYASMELTKQGDGEISPSLRVRPQKQQGLYAVLYQCHGGLISYEQLKRFFDLTKDMELVEYRLSVEGGIYALNCTASEAKKILQETPDGANTQFETSTACVGRSRCSIGACNSQKLLEDCRKAVSAQNFVDGILPRIAISGCISSCGAHQSSALGFRGIVKRTADGVSPAFYVFWGGSDRKGEEVLADSSKILLAEDIPDFLVELGRQVTASGETYETWIRKYPKRMEALIDRYELK